MNITYDPEHRSLYLKLKDGKSTESAEVAPGIVFDYDDDGVIVGIDIDDTAQTLGLDDQKLSA